MEATSLDNAVEAMLAPEPSEENQSEAVEAAEAPTQDVESEAVEDICLLYTSPSPRDGLLSRMPSSA